MTLLLLRTEGAESRPHIPSNYHFTANANVSNLEENSKGKDRDDTTEESIPFTQL